MIAHHIARKAGASAYARLGCYILDIKHPTDEQAFDRLAGYVVDRVGDGHRVVAARVTNCADDDLEMAITEIELVQARNTRSRSDKSYHLVISFPEGERPTLEQLRDIEDHLVAAIGFSEHQRISAVHDDTDNLHVHVAINKVHPKTLRNVAPHNDYPKLMAACRELELRHDLLLDNHGLSSDQIHNLGQEAEPTRRPERAKTMEAHSGCQSLSGWIATHARDDILKVAATASSWEVIHEVFARYGLELRPKGAGLVAGVPGSKTWVKASSIDRSLSGKALTDRLGAYKAQVYDYGRPQQTYDGAVQRSAQARRLHADYRAARTAAERGRAVAMAEVNTRHGDYAQRLREHYRKEKGGIRIRHDLRGPLRREALGRVEAARKSAYAERDRLLADDRAAVKAAHPLPTWQGFLEERASRGDEAALSALRSRTVRRSGAFGDIITAEDLRAVQDVLYQPRMPTIMRNGDVVYQTRDGGRVTDRAAEVRTDTLSREAAFLALALASDRFPGQPLVVEGSPAFRAAVLEMSLDPIFHVTFADPALEKARRGVAHEDERKHPVPEPVRRATPPLAELRGDERLIQIERERDHSRGRSGPELSL